MKMLVRIQLRGRKGGNMKLMHFTAEWCGPCKLMKPIINQVLDENPNIEYILIDIDENPETAKDYGVMGVPSFITFDDNDNVLQRAVGAMSKAEFVKRLQLT
jgi:thioredoxin 1